MEAKTILKALFELKKEIGKMTKDSSNPFFKSKYFDINQLLEHVEPLALKNDLLIMQPILDGKVTTEIVCIKTGDSVKSELSLSDQKDPQKVGSEITYFRRYTLASLLGIQAVDDDGNLAVKPEKKPFVSTVMSIKRELTTKDVEKWNGKIYKENCIYVGTEMIECTLDQLTRLKALSIYKPETK